MKPVLVVSLPHILQGLSSYAVPLAPCLWCIVVPMAPPVCIVVTTTIQAGTEKYHNIRVFPLESKYLHALNLNKMG